MLEELNVLHLKENYTNNHIYINIIVHPRKVKVITVTLVMSIFLQKIYHLAIL